MNIASIYSKFCGSQALSELMEGDYNLSAFIPALENGIPALRGFLYAAVAQGEAYRPFAWLSVSWDSGALLRFAHCAAQDFMDIGEHPLSEHISMAFPQPLSVEEYMLEEQYLAAALDTVQAFCFAPRLTKEQRLALADYYSLFKRHTPAALLPYYRGLSPEFHAWMDAHIKGWQVPAS